MPGASRVLSRRHEGGATCPTPPAERRAPEWHDHMACGSSNGRRDGERQWPASDAEFLFEVFQCDEIFHPARFTISLGLAHRVLFIITQIEAVGFNEINELFV